MENNNKFGCEYNTDTQTQGKKISLKVMDCNVTMNFALSGQSTALVDVEQILISGYMKK